MRFDFGIAARRHRADAETLLASRRNHNSDQLVCLAAECALKQTLIRLGVVPTLPDGDIPPRSGGSKTRGREHLPLLRDEYFELARGRQGARYLSPLVDLDEPFADWSIDQRYCDDAALPGSSLEAHRRACRQCFVVLARVELDGA